MYTNNSCTIYHRGYDPVKRMDTWSRTYVEDVYLETTRGQKLMSEGWSSDCNMFLIIPYQPLEISEQDIIVEGIADEDISSSFSVADIHKKYNAFTVIAVDKFNFGYNPHYEIRGK